MNKFETKEIKIQTLPSGDSLSIRKFTFTSQIPGPSVYIQASVHGAELQGNPVICELIKYFEKVEFKGTINFLPLANPLATNNKVGTWTLGRFNSVTGDNWNRNYTDIIKIDSSVSGFDIDAFAKEHLSSPPEKIKSEFKRRLFLALTTYQNTISEYGSNTNKNHFLTLQSMAADADYVLDLHTGPKAARYIYTADYEKEKALDLCFPHYLVIPNEFGTAMDEACFMPWVHLQKAFNKLGSGFEIPFEAYTVELGSEEVISFSEAKDDAARILHFLKKRGVIEASPDFKNIKASTCSLKDFKTYYAPTGALYEYIASPGDKVSKGEILAKGLNFNKNDIVSSDDFTFEVLAKEDCIVINHCPSASVQQGSELFQVMENYS